MPARTPFPGMDPWLEQSWSDVRPAMVAYTRDALNRVLPSRFVARMEERGFIETGGASGTVQECATIVRHEDIGTTVGSSGSEPLVIDFSSYQVIERYVQILDRESKERIITTIDFLSASNKRPGVGQRKYLGQRKRMRARGISLVEIDLLRVGQRIIMANSARLSPSHRTTYQASVWRAARPSRLEVYRIAIREQLPVIRVPLRPADGDVSLELQAIFDQAYWTGRYESTDYSVDPQPPLNGEDNGWAEEILLAAGMR